MTEMHAYLWMSFGILVAIIFGRGKEAKLCFLGHALMENRNGLVVDTRLTEATGTAERFNARQK